MRATYEHAGSVRACERGCVLPDCIADRFTRRLACTPGKNISTLPASISANCLRADHRQQALTLRKNMETSIPVLHGGVRGAWDSGLAAPAVAQVTVTGLGCPSCGAVGNKPCLGRCLGADCACCSAGGAKYHQHYFPPAFWIAFFVGWGALHTVSWIVVYRASNNYSG